MTAPGPRVDAEPWISAHAHGWAVCKADSIEAMPWGWRLRLDRPGERQRLVFTSGTPEGVLPVLREASPATTLRLCGDPDWWRRHLPPGWCVDHEGWYYRVRLAGHPDPDRQVTVHRNGPHVWAGIDVDGATVASGQAGRWGRCLTLDSIEVHEDHRRHGLGRSVVAALCRAGRESGCVDAVLSSTPMGRGLYESLGWTLIGDQVCATRR